MTKSRCAFLCAVIMLCPLSSSLKADVVNPYITGTSTATLLTEGSYAGWYLYEIKIEWTLNQGLSHWDLILKPGCAQDDHLIEFPNPAGFSTGNLGLLNWDGFFELWDKSLDPEVYNPLVKYEPLADDDVKSGSGTFYFYSNIIPEYKGPYIDVLVAKNGNQPDVWGDLTGAYPSCTIVPEPATITLLGAGMLIFLGKKRSR